MSAVRVLLIKGQQNMHDFIKDSAISFVTGRDQLPGMLKKIKGLGFPVHVRQRHACSPLDFEIIVIGRVSVVSSHPDNGCQSAVHGLLGSLKDSLIRGQAILFTITERFCTFFERAQICWIVAPDCCQLINTRCLQKMATDIYMPAACYLPAVCSAHEKLPFGKVIRYSGKEINKYVKSIKFWLARGQMLS